MEKGQRQVSPAQGAAGLIITIGVFIILFTVLLNPEARNELLDLDSTKGEATEPEKVKISGKTLLSEFPDDVFAFSRGNLVKDLGNVAIFSTLDGFNINLADSLTVSNTLFSRRDKTLVFNLDNPNDIEELKFFAFVKNAKGKVLIELNNGFVFDGILTNREMPVTLPTNLLANYNLLRISASDFNGAYEFSNVMLTAKQREERKRDSKSFVLSAVEKRGIEEAELHYFVNCLERNKRGELSIILNGADVINEFIFCDVGEKNIDISDNLFIEGTNVIEFVLSGEGDIRIEDIILNIDFVAERFPKYDFDVSDRDFRDIAMGSDECLTDCEEECFTTSCLLKCRDECEGEGTKGRIVLLMEFEDGINNKRASITVNRDQFNINTNEDVFIKDISDFIVRGNNVIKIIPRNNFNIRFLRAYIQ